MFSLEVDKAAFGNLMESNGRFILSVSMAIDLLSNWPKKSILGEQVSLGTSSTYIKFFSKRLSVLFKNQKLKRERERV